MQDLLNVMKEGVKKKLSYENKFSQDKCFSPI